MVNDAQSASVVEAGSAEDDDSDGFSFALEMAAASCPECDTVAEPGPCPQCGAEVPATEEISEVAQARGRALEPFAKETQVLRTRFEHPPEATIPLTNDQFVACLQDTGVLARIQQVMTACHDLSALDMNDPQAIGTEVRQAVAASVDEIRELTNIAEELARFAPPGPASELRDMGIHVSRLGSDVIARLIETVTAKTIEEAKEANRLMQAALDSFNFPTNDLFERLEEYAQPDVDARVSLVLDKPGTYTDEFGFIDTGKVFGAFAGEETLFQSLAERARAYFSHLVPSESLSEGAAVALILPAVMLGTLDRPLVGHRAARGMVALFETAMDRDADQVREIVKRSTNEGPRMFAAASRIYKGMRQMYLADKVEGIDEDLALREVMHAYQELSESSYKAYGLTVLDLQAIVEGQPVSNDERLPTLGPLKQRLDASEGDLARLVGAALDPGLRNASAHAQYRWDEEALEIEDFDTGQRWSLDDLQQRVDSLVGTSVGLDAGFCCMIVSEGFELEPPDWLLSGRAPGLTAMLAETIFSASGYPGVLLEDKGATVRVRNADISDLTPLMTALGGLTAVIPPADSYKVIDAGSGVALLDVPGDEMRAARDAVEHEKDLAIMRALCSSAGRTGRDEGDAVRESLAVQAKVVCVTAMIDVVEHGVRPDAFSRMRARFEAVREFALSRRASDERELEKLAQRFERAIALTYAVVRNEGKELVRLGRSLDRIIAWAEAQGVVWPPHASVR